MARKARVKTAYGFYHVHQTGDGSRPLFRNDEDRIRFLDVLKRTQHAYGFRLHAYCVLSADEYHLVLDTNGCDLSSLMKSIDIGYALQSQDGQPLFRERYRSRLLPDVAAVEAQMRSIRRSSGSVFDGNCQFDAEHPIPLDWIAAPGPVRQERVRTIPEARERLEHLAREGRMSLTALLGDRSCRNRLIRDFRRQSTLSLKDLGTLFGGLSESSISRILNA